MITLVVAARRAEHHRMREHAGVATIVTQRAAERTRDRLERPRMLA